VKGRFWLDDRGSLLSWLALSLILLILMMALLVDGGRYFLLKSRMLQTAEMGVILSAQFIDLKPIEEIQPMAQMLVNTKLAADKGFLSQTNNDFTVRPLTIQINAETGTVSVGLSATLSPFFLKNLGIASGLEVQVMVAAKRQVQTHHIALLLDGSTAPETAVYLANMKQAAAFLTSKLDKLTGSGKISLALIPHMTRLMNIAPHKEWVRTGLWPSAIPPHAPGRALWTGEIEAERWCVLPRSGPSGRSADLPSTVPFDLEMEITVQTASDGVDEFRVTTTNECPKTPVHPLSLDMASVASTIQQIEAAGDFYPGRGLVWAGRILSANWKDIWRNHHSQKTPKKQIIFMMVGAAPLSDATDKEDWKATCDILTGQGAKIVAAGPIYVVDELRGGCPAGEIAYLGADYKAAAVRLLASLIDPIIIHVE